MPRPRKGESESDFIGRCMDSAEARRDKPGKTERLGMCYGLWRQGPVEKAAARTLYVSRPLDNADELIAWAKDQGFGTTLPPESMHVTVAFSKEPFDWNAAPREAPAAVFVPGGGERSVMPLGDEGAVVLRFESVLLTGRWRAIRDAGASWDFDEYRPHVTISWQAEDVDLDQVEPFRGNLIFGPERWVEIDPEWRAGIKEARMQKVLKGQVAKVDDSLGLVFGWAIISKINGEPYYDSQDDHIPEDAMLKATTEFMANSRAAKVMHSGEQVGDIVFGYPLTTDVAKALGIDTKQTGFLIAYRPADRAMLEKFRSGEFTGFSIGGSVAEAEETEEAG